MHDSFESLLSRCQRYHRKRMLKRAGWVVLLLCGVASIGFITLQNATFGMQQEHPQIAATPIAAVMPPVVEASLEPSSAASVSNDADAENAASLSSISAAAPQEAKKHRDVAYSVAVDESYLLDYTASKQKAEQQTKPVPAAKTKQEIGEKKKSVQIPFPTPVSSKDQSLKMRTKKLLSVEELMVQQEKEPRYELALKVAELYYDEAKYSQASLWSKKANMLDKEAEGAWVMYAKSEYARGNRERAMDILSLYLANKNSKEAEMLLMTWRQGE